MSWLLWRLMQYRRIARLLYPLLVRYRIGTWRDRLIWCELASKPWRPLQLADSSSAMCVKEKSRT